jgi:hypothetical protein
VSESAETQKSRTQAVFNSLAPDYDVHGPGNFAHFGRRLVEVVGVEPGHQVLDVATGRGAVLFPAAQHAGSTGRVVGIDLADTMLQVPGFGGPQPTRVHDGWRHLQCGRTGRCDPEASMQDATYLRLYADEQGESHFGEVEVTLTPVDFAPPAPPLAVAPLSAATRCFLVGGPADWGGDVPHPAPRRQLFCLLEGRYEVTASDGEVRTFGPGSLLLLEDTTGKGHSTRIVGGGDFLILGVALPD